MIKKHLPFTGFWWSSYGLPRPPGNIYEPSPTDAIVKHRKRRKRKNKIAEKSRAGNRRKG